MKTVTAFNIGDNFFNKLALQLIKENGKNNDFSHLACVFSGKRQALFLDREMARLIGGAFFPPKAFSLDEFIEYIYPEKKDYKEPDELILCKIIYDIAKNNVPDLLKARESFAAFLPWARQILTFIGKLDMEDVPSSLLKDVSAAASIGYPVPDKINLLLENLKIIRDEFHQQLERDKIITRPYRFLKASENIKDIDLGGFEKIILCNFFYLQKTELKIIKKVFDSGKADFYFQGDSGDWGCFKELEKKLLITIRSEDTVIARSATTKQSAGTKDCFAPIQSGLAMTESYKANLHLYSCPDTVSQASAAGKIINEIKDTSKTAIVLPDIKSLMPLLTELSFIEDFNVSAGYPITKSTLYGLIKDIIGAQERMSNGKYYSKDYLKVLLHPLAKNIAFLKEAKVTRILAHKIEEILTGKIESGISGALFIAPDEVMGEEKIFEESLALLNGEGGEIKKDDLKAVLTQLHEILFIAFEKIAALNDLAAGLEVLLDVLTKKSFMAMCNINPHVAGKLYKIAGILGEDAFSGEKYTKEETFHVFEDIAKNSSIKFKGTPLKGLQIVGLYETHSLNFENVIVLDTNEGKLPGISTVEALIPREVLGALGVERAEREEEIEKYQFTRLISGAKEVHLMYINNDRSRRSRFVEELIWEREKAAGKVDVIKAQEAGFSAVFLKQSESIEKSKEIMGALNNFRFSATKVDTYLKCPKSFYFKYILGLEEKEEIEEDIQGVDIGNYVHKVFEDSFKVFLDKKPVINQKFKKQFFKGADKKYAEMFLKRMKEDSFLLKEVIDHRLNRFIEEEEKRQVKKLISIEDFLNFNFRSCKNTYKFVAKIDRVDEMEDGEIMILDYKTGANIDTPSKTLSLLRDEVFDRKKILKRVKSFQLPIYMYAIQNSEQSPLKGIGPEKMNSALYDIRYSKLIKLWNDEDDEEKNELFKTYMDLLGDTLDEITDPDIPIVNEEDERKCGYCPYHYACR